MPNVDEDVDALYSIEGQPPALDQLPEGCTFAPVALTYSISAWGNSQPELT